MSAIAPDLSALFRAHANAVARWAARLGGPMIDVDDVVQEVFLVLHRRRPELIEELAARAWLYRTTENVVRHRRRRDRMRRWLSGSADEVAAHVPSPDPSPQETAESRETNAAVYRLLDRMPAKYRNVLALFELEGLSGEEIAQLLGVRTGTVWVQLHRARARFLELAGRDDALARDPGGAAATTGPAARSGRTP